MDRNSSNSDTQIIELPKQTLLEAKGKKKLRMLMKAHEGQNVHFIENQKEEYVQYDQQDYNDLEKWKKNLILKESDDVSDKIKKRFQHIQSLKDDILMPELNFDIIDSVMNPKYYNYDDDEDQEDQDYETLSQNQNIETQESNKNQDMDNSPTSSKIEKKLSILINPEFKSTKLSAFSAHQEKQNFSDYTEELTQNKSPKEVEINQPKNKMKTHSHQLPQSQSEYKSRINTQSSIFIQRNYNKNILNNLLLSRITKKYSFNQKNEEKQNLDESNNSKKKVSFEKKIDGLSFFQQGSRQKDQSLEKVKQIFSEETEKFSKTTLNTFKNVGNQFYRLANVIDYDTLMKDIINTIYHPSGILGMKAMDGKKGNMQFDLESFNYLEKTLLDNYHRCTKEIKDYQQKIRDERLFQTTISQELKICHEEMTNLLTRVENEEEMLKNEMRNASTQQMLQHSQYTKMNITRFRNVQNPDIKVKHKKIEEEKEEIRVYFSTMKKAIIQRMKSSIEKLEIMDKEILKIKQKRNTTKMILKDLYFKSLKSDSYLSTQSLVWIIKSLININEDLSNTNIFPSFLDEQSKQFLISWAKLLIEQDKVQDQIKGINIDNINISQQYQNVVMESSKVNTSNSRQSIQQKMHRLARGSHNQNWSRSTDSSPAYSSSTIIQYNPRNNQNYSIFPDQDEVKHPNYENNNEKIVFDLNQFPSDCIQTVEMKNDMRHELMKICNIIDKLKENERNRLCSKVKSNTPGYQQKLITLQQMLQALFGKQQGEIYFCKHQKDMQLFDEKVNNVKFFKFSHLNIQNKKIPENNNGNEDHISPQNNYSTNSKLNSMYQNNLNYSKEEQQQNNNNLIKDNQRLSLPKTTIQNFKEKKKSIAENQQIMMQYNQLSEQLFNTKKRNSYNNVVEINNNNNNNLNYSPFSLNNYFLNPKQKQLNHLKDNQITSQNTHMKSPSSVISSNNFFKSPINSPTNNILA